VAKENREILQHISATLDEVLVILKKPRNKALRILEIGGEVVSILAILGIIEVVINWFFGG
jgi:hypothetical protein